MTSLPESSKTSTSLSNTYAWMRGLATLGFSHACSSLLWLTSLLLLRRSSHVRVHESAGVVHCCFLFLYALRIPLLSVLYYPARQYCNYFVANFRFAELANRANFRISDLVVDRQLSLHEKYFLSDSGLVSDYYENFCPRWGLILYD